MPLGPQSPRVIVGCVIALTHAAAIYGLTTLGSRASSGVASAPVAVRFIVQQEAPPSWRPPEVRTVAQPIVANAPQLPLLETERSSDRVITPPPQLPPLTRSDERAAPRLVSAVEYLREPAPHYPPQSRRLREQGVVVLRVVIDERGRACNIEIESSSGYARLDRAAREAVASAEFRPYLENGAARRAQVLIPIEFSLSRGSA